METKQQKKQKKKFHQQTNEQMERKKTRITQSMQCERIDEKIQIRQPK